MHMGLIRLAVIGLAFIDLSGGNSASAQVRTIDPNRAIDGDLAQPAPRSVQRPTPRAQAQPVYQAQPAYQDRPAYPDQPVYTDQSAPPVQSQSQSQSQSRDPSVSARQQATADATTRSSETYERDDILAAGEGVFGKGAQGFAGIIERTLKEQGRPNAYIAGHEAAGAFVVGLRYGSGVMSHKVEGQQPVYWTGPSVGFDIGGDATKVFVLVYNLYDTADLYHRFPGAEGRLYAIGGFSATYLRRGNVVLIPIRLGVGWRAGVNVGYMNFTHKSRLLPF